jgi:hypothetical protein
MDTEIVKQKLLRKLTKLLEEFDIQMMGEEFVHTYKNLYIQNEPPFAFNQEKNVYEEREKPRMRLLGMMKEDGNTYKKRQVYALGASEFISHFVNDRAMDLYNRLSMVVFLTQEIQLIEKLEKRQAKLDAWTSGEMAFEKFGNFGEKNEPDADYSFMESIRVLKWDVEKMPRTKLLRKLIEKEKDPNFPELLKFEFKLADTEEL